MSIADKLVTIAENQRAIYDKGNADGWDLGYGNGQGRVENLVTCNGERAQYGYAFAYQDWTGYTFSVPIMVKGSISNMFFTYQGTELPNGIDYTQATGTPDYMFRYSPKLTRIRDINLPVPTKYQLTFGDMNSIKKIDIVRCNENTVFTDTFRQVKTLEEVTFEGVIGQNGLNLQWSTELTRESLLSILNCLQDKTSDTSGTTWKVTIGSANLAKLTTEEIERAEQKGWMIV